MMRTEFDAVMIGIGTVLVDDPLLTVRLPGLAKKSPVRVILDRDARLPLTARLLQSIEEARLIVFTGPEAPEERVIALKASGAEVVSVARATGGIDLVAVLAWLAKDGITRVLVEGGAEVASSLVTGDLLDEVVLFRASVVVGPDGVRALGHTALSAIERSPRYRQIEAGKVGDDIMRRYVRGN
jgi:diaminohydroxyphosphoribosylaminopyrimidine deaminase/5-amino-6-(5-phosphoribosylamino)uracil reductase